jgi:UDP-glucose 4-epimerase
MQILVTGGAGYIGSHAVRDLLDHGFEVTVLDNLSTGHAAAVDPRAHLVGGSTGDVSLLVNLFHTRHIHAVLHFAASIEVGESVTDPAKYYQNNFVSSLSLLQAMQIAKVKRLVFSSTAAVYGSPEMVPIEEGATLRPINPYGRSKMMTELAIQDFCRAYGLGYAILRYFNVAGAMPDGSLGEDHEPESHLIPNVLAAARDSGSVRVFGTDYETKDGTCVRDYVHVTDLVAAHRLAVERVLPGLGEVYNVGSESGFSVRQVIQACEEVTGQKISVAEEGRRPGDPPMLVASSKKIKQSLGWRPERTEIKTIVADAWHWHQKHPRGYRISDKIA